MVREKFPRLTGGLNTLVDPLIGFKGSSPDCSDVEMHTGLLRQRKGFRRLANEPSASGMARLEFTGGGTNAASVAWTSRLGTSSTIVLVCDFAQSVTNATRSILHITPDAGGGYPVGADPIIVRTIGDGTNVKVRVILANLTGEQTTLDSTNRTVAQWQAIGGYQLIRIVRDEGTAYLYIGPNLEASGSMFVTTTKGQFAVADDIFFGYDGTTNAADMDVYSCGIVNRVLSLQECYFPLTFPMDDIGQPDVLGAWAFHEATGTSVNDFSLYNRDLTISGAAWNATTGSVFARGLGIFTLKTRAGKVYNILAASKTGGSSPSGALTAWEANASFYPFYWAGVKGATASDLTLTGLDFLARWTCTTTVDLALLGNGRDYGRKYGGATPAMRYLGITAPPVGPVVAAGATGGDALMADGTYGFVQTFFNSNTGLESAASPATFVTLSGGGTNQSVTVNLYTTDDPQVTHIRAYATTNGGTVYYRIGQAAVSTTASLTRNVNDTQVVAFPTLVGQDVAAHWNLRRKYRNDGPAVAPTVTPGGGGNVTNGVHMCAYYWKNSTTGAISGFSPATSATAGGGNNTFAYTLLGVPPNSDYDQIVIVMTKAGARDWYIDQTITAATTATGNTADANLTDFDHAVQSLPPKCRYSVAFADRVFYAGDPDYPSTFYWSMRGEYESVRILNGHIANPGAEITGLHANETALFIHFDDGRIFVLPHPGDEAIINTFVALNTREWATKGAAVSHYSIQNTPYGTVWLGRNGFYRAVGDGVELVSATLTPTFLNLNRQRAKYANALYMDDRQLYVCWVSRGNQRVNEQAFVCYLPTGTWTVWNVPADAAGTLLDAQGEPHYCFFQPLGLLCEFRDTVDYDGDVGGTTNGTISGATMSTFTTISQTAPTGGDGGYSIQMRKSDGTVYLGWKIPSGMSFTGDVTFWPARTEITSGTWAAYLGGIRGLWTTMKTALGNLRPDKSFLNLFVGRGKESAGTLKVEWRANDASAWTAETSTVDLTKNLDTPLALHGAHGRDIQFRVSHDPPTISEPWKIAEIELEGEHGGDTA